MVDSREMWTALEERGYSAPTIQMNNGMLRGVINKDNRMVSIQVEPWNAQTESSLKVVSEAQLEHPNILHIIETFLFCKETVDYVIVVTEGVRKCLVTDLRNRAQKFNNFSGEELKRHFKDLIFALAYLQTLRISHKKISANSVFFTSTRDSREIDTIKLGNFLWCETINENTSGPRKIREDVFALGSTFEMMKNAGNVPASESHILEGMINWMKGQEHSDFKTLKEYYYPEPFQEKQIEVPESRTRDAGSSVSASFVSRQQTTEARNVGTQTFENKSCRCTLL